MSSVASCHIAFMSEAFQAASHPSSTALTSATAPLLIVGIGSPLSTERASLGVIWLDCSPSVVGQFAEVGTGTGEVRSDIVNGHRQISRIGPKSAISRLAVLLRYSGKAIGQGFIWDEWAIL